MEKGVKNLLHYLDGFFSITKALEEASANKLADSGEHL